MIRAFPLRELKVDAHGLEGEEDIGEDDGGVYPQSFNRQQGYLRCQLRGLAQGEKRVLPPQGAVLFEKAACLTHEPDRRVLGRLPLASP